MNKPIRFVILTFFAISISACGWQPLYKKTDPRNSCKNFTVENKGLDIIGQKFKYTLQDRLNNLCLDSEENYQITTELIEGSEGLAIQKDREITRYNAIITAIYTITNDSGKAVSTGRFKRVGGYDAQTSHYATYALAEDAKSDIVEDLANEMAMHISTKISKMLDEEQSKK